MTPITIAKIVGGPGSLGFLVVGCLIGLWLAYVWPKRTVLGSAWLLGLLVLYAVLALPPVAHSIAAALPSVPRGDIGSMRSIDELIVLGGDNEDGRVTEAVRAWRRLGPHFVLVLGDDVFAQRVIAAGIPAAGVRRDGGPQTTRSQMQRVQEEDERQPGGHIALIASRLQMPRVIELSRVYRLRLLFLSSPLDREPSDAGRSFFIPSYGALMESRDALYEHAALAYYRSRGWIAEQP